MTDIDVEVMKKALVDGCKVMTDLINESNISPIDTAKTWLSSQFLGSASAHNMDTVMQISQKLFDERIVRLKRGENGEYVRDTQGNPVLESTFEKVLKEMSEERSWRLLERELGTTDFQTFQRSGLVTLRASNGKDFSITKDGHVTIHMRNLMGKKVIEGTFEISGKYPLADCVWTVVKWIKADPEVVEETIVKHCGRIYLNEGEIKV